MSIFGKRPGEPPERPCAAYFEVANVLPDAYFLAHPPNAGMILKATHSSDRITCTWYMPEHLARTVVANIGTVRGLSARLEPYDGYTTLEAG